MYGYNPLLWPNTCRTCLGTGHTLEDASRTCRECAGTGNTWADPVDASLDAY